MQPHHNPLNLLRALAVLAVFAHHGQHYLASPWPYLGTYGGLLGVQLFFLVSGYLIVQSAARQRWGVFLVGRAFRIFPAYWVALLAVSWGISHTLPLAQASDWPYFLANFLTLGHAVPYALARFDVLTVSWTLTIEWTWYLLAPPLVWGAARAARRGVPPLRYWLAVALASLAVSVAWVLSAQAGHFDGLITAQAARLGVSPLTEHLRTAFLVVAAPAQWVFFVLGVLLWVGRDALARWPVWLPWALCLVLLVHPAWWPPLLGFDPSVATGLGLAGLFLGVLRLPAGAVQGRLTGWAHRLGDWSYPIYLLHVPAMMVVLHRLQWTGGAALTASAVLTLAAAALLHHAVENPGRRAGAWCQRALARRAERPSSAAA